jgi:RNA polymerase subunit RPABC4/transcription elongation factor Spt4
MTKRLCRNCKSELQIDQDVCQSCGTNNPLVTPWYTYPLGALIVAVLIFLLVDFNDIRKLFE